MDHSDVKDGPLLMHKLQAVQRESLLCCIAGTDTNKEDEELHARKKELESQKACIIAQMAPVREEDGDGDGEVARVVPEPIHSTKEDQ
jgi:hypothetical protein